MQFCSAGANAMKDIRGDLPANGKTAEFCVRKEHAGDPQRAKYVLGDCERPALRLAWSGRLLLGGQNE